ncbi:hypothetical protein SEA_ARGAN_88 [Arthrobacter phage Argan]|nr:hypothetical protein SEA_UZUMAKI_88 [Arthrobacter phage Uzumaki]WNT45472.1 hypothetical protein SEA_ARGAN_88 [Arthrobacter phage Argan]
MSEGKGVKAGWRKINEFPKYEINRHGIIRRISTRRVKSTIQDGTLSVKLTEGGKTVHRGVRGLLMEYFPEDFEE